MEVLLSRQVTVGSTGQNPRMAPAIDLLGVVCDWSPVQKGDARPLAHPLPVGMRDFLPEEAERRQSLSRRALATMKSFGYTLVIPPAFEFADVMERGLGALSSSDVLRFIEPESGDVAALRPDMTPQIARILATRLFDRPAPFRLAYEGTVLRRRAGRARKHRQLPQVGVELAGVEGIEGDLEILEVTCATLVATGLTQFTIDLGDAGIVRPLIDALDVDIRKEATQALMAKDADALATLTDDETLPRLARAGNDRKALDLELARHQGPVRDALERLGRLYDAAKARDLGAHLSLDLAEVRGFAYYTGMIFRAYARGPGEAIGAGGRYDELMGRFDAPMPAVGFGLDLDALAVAVAATNSDDRDGVQRVLVTGPDADRKARELRATGVCAATFAERANAHAYAIAWGYTRIVDGDSIIEVCADKS
jgi:ATP phosphoribosyltransferase regulatory subunit